MQCFIAARIFNLICLFIFFFLFLLYVGVIILSRFQTVWSACGPAAWRSWGGVSYSPAGLENEWILRGL